MMQATKVQIIRTERELSAIAKETMKVEQVGDSLYSYGSELACLRVFHKYNLNSHNSKVRIGYSANLSTHYFVIDL